MEISVIITNYNYEKYIGRAIRSALNQSFNHDEYEVVVIDDCSVDNSKEVISGFGSDISAIYNQKNLGLAASCNKAINQARGKYIIRLDADDYVAKDLLLIHHAFLSNNKGEIDATSNDYLEVDHRENIVRRRSGITFPIACSVMYKIDDMIALGLYNEVLPREDEEFRRRFLNSGRHIYNIAVPLYRYYIHPNSISKIYVEK